MPKPIHYDEPYEKLARVEGERLIDMYAPGTEPHNIGQAIIRILREKKSAEAELCKNHKESVEIVDRLKPLADAAKELSDDDLQECILFAEYLRHRGIVYRLAAK